MQLLTLFSIFVLFLHFTFSEIEICEKKNPCTSCTFKDGTSVELSNIGQTGNPRFVLESKEGPFLLYNPCNPFSISTQLFKAGDYPCSNVAACLLLPGNSTGSAPTQRSLGSQDTAVFFRENNITKVNYSVPVPVHTDARFFTVVLMCSKDILFKFDVDPNASQYELMSFSSNLTTSCACKEKDDKCKSPPPPSHSKPGLSTGSILLITFFVVILVYVGMGILFNFCRGAHGTELLPNIEFWNDLPKLIVEGFLFTCTCFGRRTSYAGV